MFSRLFGGLFGCWHSHLSFPITIRSGRRRSKAAAATGTYVVCLECGKEFAYDWQEMKVIEDVPQRATRVRELATKEAA
jgi:hypothetical protein